MARYKLKGKDINISTSMDIIMAKVNVKANKRKRCEKIWFKRISNPNEEPLVCPKCKSPYWDKPRLWIKTEEDES